MGDSVGSETRRGTNGDGDHGIRSKTGPEAQPVHRGTRIEFGVRRQTLDLGTQFQNRCRISKASLPVPVVGLAPKAPGGEPLEDAVRANEANGIRVSPEE